MDLLDKIILEWGHRCEKGYPDLNNLDDLAIFERIFGTSFNSLNETDLSRTQLKKYNARVYLFVDQFKDGEPFELKSGGEIKAHTLVDGGKEFKTDSDREEIFNSIVNGTGTLTLKGEVDGEETAISTSNLKKTSRYGGKGAGSGTKIEDVALSDLSLAIQKANEGNPIDLRVGGTVYKNISGAKTVPGFPKADFTLENEDGESVVFLSHKAGSTAKQFQQYGGISDFSDHPEVKEFIAAVKDELEDPEQMVPGSGFKKAIESKDLILKAVYGNDFQPGRDFGINNVQALVQGPVKVEKSGDTYFLDSNHTVLNPAIPDAGYYPTLYATFRKNRNQFGIRDIRFGIYPAAFRPGALEIRYEPTRD